MREKLIDAIPVLGLNQLKHAIQINPAGKVLCVIVNDERSTVFRRMSNSALDQFHGLRVERIRLRVKFNQSHFVRQREITSDFIFQLRR